MLRQRGFTFVEVMVAALLSVVVVGSLMITSVFVSKDFKAVTNYDELDRHSRNALDYLGRDLRNAAQVTYGSSSDVTLTNDDGSGFSYQWNSGDSTFKRYYTNAQGTVTVTTLLTNCDVFNFNFYNRIPNTNYTFFAETSFNQIKVIDVDWRCSRQIEGVSLNTESIQTAQITIRN